MPAQTMQRVNLSGPPMFFRPPNVCPQLECTAMSAVVPLTSSAAQRPDFLYQVAAETITDTRHA